MRVLIVDDHPVMRSGIRVCLRDLDSTIDFVEAADLQEAVHATKADASIDLVLFDLTLPGVSGVESLIAFRDAVDPCPPVVVFSGTDDAATVAAALDAGAMGFIPKTSTPAILQSALRLVLAHGIYVPPSILGPRCLCATEPHGVRATALAQALRARAHAAAAGSVRADGAGQSRQADRT